MATRTWHCGNGHTFTYGDEPWHYDLNQGFLDTELGEPDHAPIPTMCTADFDEHDEAMGLGYEDDPCLDSTSLIYDQEF